MEFVDRILVCRECGREFIFTAGEQQFYKEKGFHDPTRCPECRAARKRNRQDRSVQRFRAICDLCGRECEVPFEPRGDRPVYCRDCFLKLRRR